ncbi:mannose-1-phosphate guanylyltransferase [Alkalihalobacillus sp. LMS6]|uniref:sugar phosphate nucleotidyltransferase n=1 Tax=Alkalihalobacillus sp. LMS6 TaxID=2924034 RepID=UPI0020D1E4B9|nr:sugar phosphate nucleotidyltransferase [Alkalihalobacillus sp. LMS6]UTR06078.1 mannose-1-phosphate guanylyltransferase [Alkalihalobacillus sp. LMS6]
MRLVLLSGGSGKRLWPLSNDSRSKQFLKVLEGEGDTKSSMVERVWRQLEKVKLDKSTIIATSYSQVDMITNQLGQNVPLIIEPERRDTFPAIALAATYLYSIQGVSLDEAISILPVDPYVDEDFFIKVKELELLLKNTNADLGLIGVSPTYPSSKYGYIVPEEVTQDNYIKVSHFQEKPTEKNAEILIKEGALWNTGVFAFKLRTVINILIEKDLPVNYNELLNNYSELPKISFDYEVVERLSNIVSLSYDGYWKDLGTWNTLTDEMKTSLIGKGTISADSNNTHVVNELDIPVAALGLDNIVVAASADGILVTDKSASPRIKELVKDFNQRPMFEERRWGSYQVIDSAKFENGESMLTKRFSILPDKYIGYHHHETRNEVWNIVNGEGLFILDGIIKHVKSGDILNIQKGSKHAIKALTKLEFIEVQLGTDLNENDIDLSNDEWESIELLCQKEFL